MKTTILSIIFAFFSINTFSSSELIYKTDNSKVTDLHAYLHITKDLDVQAIVKVAKAKRIGRRNCRANFGQNRKYCSTYVTKEDVRSLNFDSKTMKIYYKDVICAKVLKLRKYRSDKIEMTGKCKFVKNIKRGDSKISLVIQS